MAKWIPGVATFGLLCLMIIPAPGIWGVLIGGICALAIIISAALWMLDLVATRILVWRDRVRSRPSARRRAVHAGSGMAKKV